MTTRDAQRLALWLGLVMFFVGCASGYAVARMGDGAVPGAVAAQSAGRSEYAILYDDGTWRLLDAAPTLVPTATDAPLPSLTPTATLTRTPTPAPASATPTRESGVTPSPTQPSEKECAVKTGSFAIRERREPSTTAAIVDTIPPGSVVKLSQFVRGGAYLWGRTFQGWMVVAEFSATGHEFWVYGLDVSELCSDVEGWPAGLTPPAPIAYLPGLHLLFSAQWGPVLDGVRDGRIRALKGLDGTEQLLRAARDVRPDLYLVWRNLSSGAGVRDCPASWGQGDARAVADAWWASQYATWQQRGVLGLFDNAELINECGAPDSVQWEVDFWVRSLENAQLAGVCLAVFSDAYGTPEIARFVARRPVLDWMLAHECRPGERHAVAIHVYEGVAGGAWRFGRWQMFLSALGDAKYARLPWLVTEYSQSFGTGAADCGAMLADWQIARERYGAHPEIRAVFHFSVGGATGWTDLTPCLPALR